MHEVSASPLPRSLPGQLLLDLRLSSEASFATWHSSPGQHHVLKALRQMLDARGSFCLFLHGPPGSGRSHLLQAIVHQARAAKLRSQYLPLGKMEQYNLEEVLDTLSGLDLLCLDDVETLLGVQHREQLLFHLFNRLRSQGTRLLLSAAAAPRQLGCRLPDLRTRLAGAVVYRLDPISDEDKKHALLLHARQRGLELPAAVLDYLLHQYRRDMPSLMRFLDELEYHAARGRREITLPLVSGLLKGRAGAPTPGE